MTWTVHLDESGIDQESPVWIMAAVLAFDTRWGRFATEWREMLTRHGLKEIHCRKLRHELGYDHARFKAVMAEVETIVLSHVPVSIVAVMAKADYDEIYKPTKPVGGAKHGPLGVLYRASMSFFASFLEQYPPDNLDHVRFVYEKGVKQGGGLLAIHGEFQNGGEVDDWFGPLSFEAKDSFLGLQAADCLAAGGLQRERSDHSNGRDDVGQSSFVMTGETPTTLDAPVIFRLPVTREIIESLRDEILLTKAERAALRWR
jgi:hypothetical protein